MVIPPKRGAAWTLKLTAMSVTVSATKIATIRRFIFASLLSWLVRLPYPRSRLATAPFYRLPEVWTCVVHDIMSHLVQPDEELDQGGVETCAFTLRQLL